MNALKRPRVLLADDHRLVDEGLKSLLAADFELVGVVEDGRALVEAAKTLQPAVVVTDITMPRLNGIDALVQLRRDNPGLLREPTAQPGNLMSPPAAASTTVRP